MFSEKKTLDESDVLIGQCIRSRFLIERRIDKGGFGAVYLAQDLQLVGRKVVIKVLLDSLIHDAEARRKFDHEKEALARLDHPGVVGILGAGTLPDDKPFLVMPFINGQNLKDIIAERGALPLGFCAKVIENLTDALAATHARHILHRDVKPANIILTKSDDGAVHTRLIDFGVARVYDSKISPVTKVEKVQGTVWYMAPEQLQGRLEQSTAVDVFSCSVVFYEMLTGKRPFNPSSIYEMSLLHQAGVVHTPKSLRPELSGEVDRLIIQGLAYDERHRPNNICAYGKALAAALIACSSKTDVDLSEHLLSAVKNRNAQAALSHHFNPLPEKLFSPKVADSNVKDSMVADLPHQIPIVPQTAIIEKDKAENISLKTLTAHNSDFEPPPLYDARLNNGGLKIYLIIASLISGAVVLITACVAFGLWSARTDKQVDSSSARKSQTLPSESDSTASVPPVSARLNQTEVSYYLMVQKMRDGVKYQTPFRASGAEIFENGYRFQIFLKSTADGHLYLINEGKGLNGKREFVLLYPTRSRNEGSAVITADKLMETSQLEFGGSAGTEKIWMIWSREESPGLEKIRRNALQNDNYLIQDEQAQNELQKILQTQALQETTTSVSKETMTTGFRGNGDLLIYLTELEHR